MCKKILIVSNRPSPLLNQEISSIPGIYIFHVNILLETNSSGGFPFWKLLEFPYCHVNLPAILFTLPAGGLFAVYVLVPSYNHPMLMTLRHVYLPCRGMYTAAFTDAGQSIAIDMEKGAMHDKNKPNRDSFVLCPFN